MGGRELVARVTRMSRENLTPVPASRTRLTSGEREVTDVFACQKSLSLMANLEVGSSPWFVSHRLSLHVSLSASVGRSRNTWPARTLQIQTLALCS